MASTNAPVVTVFGDPTDAPDGRTLTVSQGLHLIDNGPGETLNIAPSDRLASLATMDSDGMVSYNSTTKTYTPLQLIGNNGISIENPFGVGGNPIFSLNPGSSVQLLHVANGSGQVQVTAPQINFAAGPGVDLSITNIGSNAAALVTIGSTGTGGATVDLSEGGTGLTSLAQGSLIVGPASGTIASTLAIGTAVNGLMYSTGTVPAWMTTSPTTGQTVIFNGTSLVWETPSGGLTSVGLTQTGSHFTITNTPLTANGNINLSLNDLGLDVGGLGVTTLAEGSIPYGPASGNVVSTLAIGTAANGLMYSTGTVPAWMTTSPTAGETVIYNGTALVWTTAATGTVTSVGMTSSDLTITGGPITSSGTFNLILETVPTNKGGTGVTSYLPGDMLYKQPGTGNVLSNLSTPSNTNSVLYTINESGSFVPAWTSGPTAAGQVFTFNGTTLGWEASGGGSGTVTSVNVNGDSQGIVSFSGGPITSSGTITSSFSLANLSSNFASNNFAGSVSANPGANGTTVSNSNVKSNSLIFCTIQTNQSADYGVSATVTSISAGSNFTVNYTHNLSSSGSPTLNYWIINP